LQEAKAAVVRERVLEGAATVLAAGDPLTFSRLATVAGVPERTVYRHFPTREALLTAVYEWANRRIGFDLPHASDDERATTADDLADQVRRTFPGFDEMAPVIRELLITPDGLAARLSGNERRRAAAEDVVRREAPGLDVADARRVAAVLQLLTSAAAWQSLRDYWDMDGPEAAETSALAIRLVLAGARHERARRKP
jgi:AcrR family transcriptional regulator